VVKHLALAPRHRLHRERVIVVLWPARDPAAAENNLHQVLHVARRQLAGGRQLRLDDEVLSLCAAEPVWIDAEVFRDEAVAALRSHDPERAQAALALFGGQLLWAQPTPVASSRPARG
jgi:DNA-binding SARP family transcriptional activator